MAKQSKKVQNRQRIKRRVRATISGTAERPRLSVFRSNQHIYAQLIDDTRGHTLAAASDLDEGVSADGKTPSETGKLVGQRLAEKAKEAGIERVVFDRNGYRYHGRVRALAEGAREGGLQF
ncbi:MAG: 50S ribosomal protein L18 [Rhodothermales bacterium]|nr:50S ribosomal protein L18 [Rhodothermales bacterium]